MDSSTSGIINRDPEIMGGVPVFAGTRVPVKALIDYLKGGETLDEFLSDFPTVEREQVTGAIELMGDAILKAGTHSA